MAETAAFTLGALDMKTAVVTGGGSGIGLAVAHRLRADGIDVATIDLRPSDAELSFTADVTDRSQVDAALSAIRAQLGPVAILVNAAGLDGFKRFGNITFEDWQRVIDVNLHGVFHMIQAVLPDMVEAGWGRIVNISSSSTHSGAPYMSSLCRGQIRGQRAHQVAGARVRPERHHGQCGAARFHRHPDAAQRREARAISATSTRPSPGPRCAGSASPKTSRPHAHSWCRRKPVTSPARYWASTAVETPEPALTAPEETS